MMGSSSEFCITGRRGLLLEHHLVHRKDSAANGAANHKIRLWRTAGKTAGAKAMRATPVAPSRVSRARVVAAQASSKFGKVKKVVLAYSGGLDTSIILKWLQDEYGCEVVTFTADLGQVSGPGCWHCL
jgi:hypothetical protein